MSAREFTGCMPSCSCPSMFICLLLPGRQSRWKGRCNESREDIPAHSGLHFDRAKSGSGDSPTIAFAMPRILRGTFATSMRIRCGVDWSRSRRNTDTARHFPDFVWTSGRYVRVSNLLSARKKQTSGAEARWLLGIVGTTEVVPFPGWVGSEGKRPFGKLRASSRDSRRDPSTRHARSGQAPSAGLKAGSRRYRHFSLLGSRLLRPALEHDRAVGSAESERVRQRVVEAGLARVVGNEVHLFRFRILILEVDRRRQHLVA
jgi:hypothetical protein